jgi:hypothetical protein
MSRHNETREEYAARYAATIKQDIDFAQAQAHKVGAHSVIRVASEIDGYGLTLHQILMIALGTLLQNDERPFCENVARRRMGYPTLVVDDKPVDFDEDLPTAEREALRHAVWTARERLGL